MRREYLSFWVGNIPGRVYAALTEERYGLNVYPVVVNLLPLSPGDAAVTSYHSDFMGLIAHQDYRVINLWEVDAGEVLEQKWTTLLPYVPILKGGDDPVTIAKAKPRCYCACSTGALARCRLSWLRASMPCVASS